VVTPLESETTAMRAVNSLKPALRVSNDTVATVVMPYKELEAVEPETITRSEGSLTVHENK
jgi:hypothetical protein